MKVAVFATLANFCKGIHLYLIREKAITVIPYDFVFENDATAQEHCLHVAKESVLIINA